MATAVTARLEQWLTAEGARFRVLQHAPVFTSEEAARVRGTPPESGAKALVMLAADAPVHVVLPGSRRVDNATSTRAGRLPHPSFVPPPTGATARSW